MKFAKYDDGVITDVEPPRQEPIVVNETSEETKEEKEKPPQE